MGVGGSRRGERERERKNSKKEVTHHGPFIMASIFRPITNHTSL